MESYLAIIHKVATWNIGTDDGESSVIATESKGIIIAMQNLPGGHDLLDISNPNNMYRERILLSV